MPAFKRVREVLKYKNEWAELYDDDVVRPDGKAGTYIRLRYCGNPPGVVIVPRLPDGRFLLLHVARYAIGESSLEFPRGSAEPGESAEAAARRELQEETAFTAVEIRHLGFCRPDTAIVETEAEILLAETAPLEAPILDAKEGITGYKLMTRDALRAAIRDGAIRDGFSLGAFAFMCALGL